MLAVVGTPYHSRDAVESCWVESGEALVLTAHVTCCGSRDPKGLSLANFGLVALPSSFPICNVGGKNPSLPQGGQIWFRSQLCSFLPWT